MKQVLELKAELQMIEKLRQEMLVEKDYISAGFLRWIADELQKKIASAA